MTNKDKIIRNKEISIILINGGSVTEVAKQFDLTNSAVYSIAQKFGIKLKKAHNPSPKRCFIILKELFTDKSVKQIADEYNITHQRVYQIYSEAKFAEIPGLPIR